MNLIPLLNEQNTIIGEISIPEAYKNGCWRRVVRVFLFNSAGELLLQQRGHDVKTYPGLWDQSATGHVDVGETNYEAAVRETKEELGVDVTLTQVVTDLRSTIPEDKVFSTIYKAVLPLDTDINTDEHEVAAVRWCPLEQLDKEISETPELFVPLFLDNWHSCRDTIIRT